MIVVSELREKEVINVRDGTKLGFIDDIDVDLEAGEVKGVIISGTNRIFRLFGKNDDIIIKWKDIIRIGIDTILVDINDEN